ncbi:DUF3889 domain-containing protein [Tuberibacillus sp. Marseille-P3662]|uniref:DUF3889 domain-containing protein n=1 Tax=Tuberibacillus sp. Marseille-P3662 TaxID=1965358 RepID=UPI000A1CEC61|nr:DUF3889 domain-containing protein [Tuberibacillus sp. Marseille-P3662]
MYSNDFYMQHVHPYVNGPQQGMPYVPQPYYHVPRSYQPYPYYNMMRQQPVRGQATWTEGGQVTACGIPWSDNHYMTVAVGENTSYQCGETLKVKNLSTQRDVLVTVVDRVQGYPANRINLHREAFEALGTSPDVGVINVEITASPEVEQQKWGKYLLEVTQTAYPNYNITDYQTVGKTQISPTQTQETYDYILQSPQEKITVRGNVVYNPNTNRIVSFDLKEV